MPLCPINLTIKRKKNIKRIIILKIKSCTPANNTQTGIGYMGIEIDNQVA